MGDEYTDFEDLLEEDLKKGCGGCRHVVNRSGVICRPKNAKYGTCPCVECIVKMMWPCDCDDWRKWFGIAI